jgi:hypothetical protein
VIALVSVQDRCPVCVKGIVGSEIILDAADGTPSGNSFGLFGDTANLDTI